ncbi:MAG: sigma-70 family RNA polymerase sigma factor [Anaeromyxobacteraceae bacterium]
MSETGDSAGRPTFRVLPGGASPARREDEALVAAFLVGDDVAFGELVRRHEQTVLRLVRRWARTPDDARDLAQRTFLRAFEAARRTLGRTPIFGRPGDARRGFVFKAWLVRIAVNLAKNHRRDEARTRRAPLEAIGPEEAAPALAPAALEHEEQARRMREAVAALPRRQREVLTLRIDAELSFAEIAEALGTTENSAKVTFHHAVKRLREQLEEARP